MAARARVSSSTLGARLRRQATSRAIGAATRGNAITPTSAIIQPLPRIWRWWMPWACGPRSGSAVIERCAPGPANCAVGYIDATSPKRGPVLAMEGEQVPKGGLYILRSTLSSDALWARLQQAARGLL